MNEARFIVYMARIRNERTEERLDALGLLVKSATTVDVKVASDITCLTSNDSPSNLYIAAAAKALKLAEKGRSGWRLPNDVDPAESMQKVSRALALEDFRSGLDKLSCAILSSYITSKGKEPPTWAKGHGSYADYKRSMIDMILQI